MDASLIEQTPTEMPPKQYETVQEMMQTPIIDVDFLVDGMFPKGEFAAIVGRSGVNKSTFCRMLCVCVALPELECIGQAVRTTTRRALYIYSEDSRNSVARSFQRQLSGIDLADTSALSNIETAHLDDFETPDDLLAFLAARTIESPYDLIVFDCFSDLLNMFSIEVNSNSEQRTLFREFHEFKKDGTVILFNHHASDKATSTGNFLGASALRQKVRVMVEIVQGEDAVRYVHIEKSNYTDKQQPLECCVDDNFWFHTDGTRVPITVLQRFLQNDQPDAVAAVDWDNIFGTADTMDTATIRARLLAEYNVSESTAKRRIRTDCKKGLIEKLEHGRYRRSRDDGSTAESQHGGTEQQKHLQLFSSAANGNHGPAALPRPKVH